jgi:hypothetical protein
MISQHSRHEGAVAGILFVWAAGPVILGLFALLTRGKTVVIRSAPMSDPHLANWLFLLPAFLLGATIERGAGGAVSPRSVFPCSFGFVESVEREAEAVG